LGLGNRKEAHRAATEAMANALQFVDIEGHIVVGEDKLYGTDEKDEIIKNKMVFI
jgi:fructose-1,6-bisphosphatase/sedoheptulose 1,7-bisphosphatase-like protein